MVRSIKGIAKGIKILMIDGKIYKLAAIIPKMPIVFLITEIPFIAVDAASDRADPTAGTKLPIKNLGGTIP